MPTQRRDEKRVGEPRQHGALVGDVGEREKKHFGSSFYMFFSLPLGLPYANCA